MEYTAGSLFSGIGGIDLAFSLAGYDIKFQVEIDDFCRKVLNKHASRYWPNAIQFTDVREVGRSNLPSVDVLFGGFPCQPHSVAGKRLGASDSRNLWPDFRRVIGELRPRAVLLENVPGITSTMGAGIVADLAALGYVGRAGLIRASDAEAPHRRERWFCVAHARREGLEKRERLTGDAGEEQPPAERSGAELADATHIQRFDLRGGSGEFRPTGSQRQQGEADASLRGQGRAGRATAQPRLGRGADGLSPWLDFPGWPARPGEPQHEWEPPRTTTVKINRTARLKALGNAVVPAVIYPLAVAIRERLEEEDGTRIRSG